MPRPPEHLNDDARAEWHRVAHGLYPTLAIADLTLADAIGIYRLRYWVPAACGHLPDGLDLVVFDAAVNSRVA